MLTAVPVMVDSVIAGVATTVLDTSKGPATEKLEFIFITGSARVINENILNQNGPPQSSALERVSVHHSTRLP